ncbi:MAG: T9SS type A sorting domain-containing protein [Bacteroidales bacterium]|nr:T9SS type A sorting domain-containing protein [Bacteroidales bacterium]
MKALSPSGKHIIWIVASLFCLLYSPVESIAQATGPPDVQFIMISFDQPLTTVQVEKTALRYGKSFALSFHTDDGIEDVFTVGFPFFTGINTQGTQHPGLFYTDGCGNDISFKLSNALFSYSGYNNEDMHQPDNNYGAVTWPQLAMMYQNNCAIYNHGFTSDAFTEPDYMTYSIRRNESFIRRRLLEVTDGGVRTRIFVNPNGVTDYTPVAFSEGYRAAMRMGAYGIIPDNGGDVNSVNNWNQQLELNRVIAESIDVKLLADQLAAQSTGGVNMWMPVFTHRIIEDYPQATFYNDFNYIAETYGKNGADNIWMASEEEILNYLVVRDATTINHIVNGNTLLINLEGDIPGDMRFYPLSLTVQADAQITNIVINGGSQHSFTGIGETQALINLSWDGSILPDLITETEENVSRAEQQPTQYNALVAMDYVLMLPDGAIKEGFRQRLCQLEGIGYEAGFCADCSFSLGDDIEICPYDCLTLEAPYYPDASYIWSTGETNHSIEVCPHTTSTYYVQLTTADGCIASDTITLYTKSAPVFDLGENVEACQGTMIPIQGPIESGYTYQWYVGGELQPEATEALFYYVLTNTTFVKLIVTAENGCSTADSIETIAWPLPELEIIPQQADLCQGDQLILTAMVHQNENILWWDGSTQPQITFIADEPDIYNLWATALNDFGCTASDTAIISVYPNPIFSLELVSGSTTICSGDLITLKADLTNYTDISYIVWNNSDTMYLTGPSVVYQDFVLTEPISLTAKAVTTYGCTFSDTISIDVFPAPSMTITADTAICKGTTITLEASGGSGCSWYDSEGMLISETYQLIIHPEQSSYYVAVIGGVPPMFCQASDTVFVELLPTPELIIEATATTVCAGSAVQLTAHGADSYLWRHGPTSASIEVWPVTDTIFTVIGLTQAGCADSAQIAIEVLAVPEVMLTGLLPAYCQNDVSVMLTGYPEGGVFSGPGVDSNWFSPLTAGPGLHDIVYTITAENNCMGKDTATVRVFPFEMTIDLGPDTTLCPHEILPLDAGEGFSHYYWSTGETSQTITVSAMNYAAGMSHQIQVAGVLNGCTATGKITMTIRDDCYIGINEKKNSSLFLLTPNPTASNIRLSVAQQIEDAEVQIIDIQGNRVWKSPALFNLQSNEYIILPVTDLIAGIYFIHLITNKKILTQKLIKL